MNSEKLYSYIDRRSQLAHANVAELEKLTEQFPYFQTAHLLYSMAAKKNDASLFQRSIKRTALVAVSRNHLYNLLYNEAPVETPVVETVEPKAEKTVEVIEEISVVQMPEISERIEVVLVPEEEKKKEELDLSEQVEKEIKKDLIEAFVEKEILKTNEAHIKEETPAPKDASFGQWLHYLKKNNGQSYDQIERKVEESEKNRSNGAEDEELKQKKEHRKGLIDKIIEQNLGPIKMNKDSKFFVAEQKAKESLLENEHLVTETLAKIYALQGNINKAIRAYQILSLKYPNKSVYFASLIENLKKGN